MFLEEDLADPPSFNLPKPAHDFAVPVYKNGFHSLCSNLTVVQRPFSATQALTQALTANAMP